MKAIYCITDRTACRRGPGGLVRSHAAMTGKYVAGLSRSFGHRRSVTPRSRLSIGARGDSRQMGFTLKGSSVCKLLAGCSLGVVMALLAPSLASADGPQGRYVVDASSLSVRSKAGSFARGNVYKGDHMDVYSIDGNNWAWGYAYGTYEGCGWVWRGPHAARQYLQREADQKNFKVKCGKPTNFKFSSFGFALGKKGPGRYGNDGSFAHLNDCPSKGYYGNYRGGKLRRLYGKLEKNADLRYRYTARNSDGSKSKAALVRQEGNPIGWFFVRRACVSDGPPAK